MGKKTTVGNVQSESSGRALHNYGKAVVTIGDDGTETLYSYGTKIMSRDSNGQYTSHPGEDPSKTTCTHIIAFSGMHKQDFLNVPTEQERAEEEIER